VNHYCTYFDRGYLAQGLALWGSLLRHDPSAVLWVLALDDEIGAVLNVEAPGRLRVLPLAELLKADPALAAVQSGRTRAEFIFTLTPCFTRYLLRGNAELELITYLDADLFFMSDPSGLRAELGNGSILMVEHRFPGWHNDSARYGRFNVGVLVFRNDDRGRACLDWWRERCLESCALTADGQHYGDQKYLDEWPTRFSRVVISQNPGLNVAPWNWARHHFELLPEGVRVDGKPLVVFHFAQFRLVGGRWFDSGQLEYGIMPFSLRSRIYGAYWAELEVAVAKVRCRWPDFKFPARGWSASLGPWHLALLRLVWGQFWWRGKNGWFAGRFGLGRFSGRVMGRYRLWQAR